MELIQQNVYERNSEELSTYSLESLMLEQHMALTTAHMIDERIQLTNDPQEADELIFERKLISDRLNLLKGEIWSRV